MAKPRRVQCPFCKKEVAWFYGTGTFSKHKGDYGDNWCRARYYRGMAKGAIYNQADPRFNRLRMKTTDNSLGGRTHSGGRSSSKLQGYAQGA